MEDPVPEDPVPEDPVLSDPSDLSNLSDLSPPHVPAVVDVGENLDSSEFEMTDVDTDPDSDPEVPVAPVRRGQRVRRGRAVLEYSTLGNPSIKRFDMFCIQNNEIRCVGKKNEEK